MSFKRISADAFKNFAVDAGLLLKSFDITGATTPADTDILCATTGDVSVNCAPTYSDYGEDVNGCPNNLMQMKHLDRWECTIGFSSLEYSAEFLQVALGAADVADGAITPRSKVTDDDFADYWLVCDLAGGGVAVVHLINGLSTAGVAVTFAKDTKMKIDVTLTGHVSSDEQDKVPMEFYVLEAA